MKTVDWYLLPLIREMEKAGVTLQEFTDIHMEERIGRRKQGGINNTLRSEIMMANSMFAGGIRAKMLKAKQCNFKHNVPF